METSCLQKLKCIYNIGIKYQILRFILPQQQQLAACLIRECHECDSCGLLWLEAECDYTESTGLKNVTTRSLLESKMLLHKVYSSHECVS